MNPKNPKPADLAQKVTGASAANLEKRVPVTISIPLVDPKHKNVKDYEEIEGLLRRTCFSLLNQRDVDVTIVIAGRRVPDWLATGQSRIVFIDLSECEIFDGRLPTQADTGLKRLLAAIVSEETLGSDLFFTVDADDYFHIDLCRTIRFMNEQADSEIDGFIWTRGVEVELYRYSDKTFGFGRAFLVNDFHLGCGSCRAFRLSKLIASAERFVSQLESVRQQLRSSITRFDGLVLPASAELGFILEGIPVHKNVLRGSWVAAMGRHVRQDKFFELKNVNLIGAAKGCGHGQHDGPGKGQIHAAKVVKEVRGRTFLHSFGLSQDFSDDTALLAIDKE